MHPAPPAQSLVHVPPQSTSVSPPFFEPSEHVPAEQEPFWHESPVAQSAALPHEPVPHGMQIALPQSMPRSDPFWIESVQLTATQRRCGLHLPDAQSEFELHWRRYPHLGQTVPPQSMSVSCPFS